MNNVSWGHFQIQGQRERLMQNNLPLGKLTLNTHRPSSCSGLSTICSSSTRVHIHCLIQPHCGPQVQQRQDLLLPISQVRQQRLDELKLPWNGSEGNKSPGLQS
jgi:hypothetical protein